MNRPALRILWLIGILTFPGAGCSPAPPPPQESGPAPAAGTPKPAAAEAPQPAATPPAEPRGGPPLETQTGTASFIATTLDGQKTASGEVFDSTQLVAAHPAYPLGTIVRVTNPENGRVVEVKIIDRSASGRNRPIIDVSRSAAERLDFVRLGTTRVTTEVLRWGPKPARDR